MTNSSGAQSRYEYAVRRPDGEITDFSELGYQDARKFANQPGHTLLRRKVTVTPWVDAPIPDEETW